MHQNLKSPKTFKYMEGCQAKLEKRPSSKVEKILKGSLDVIPSPSPAVKIQIMGGKVAKHCWVLSTNF